MKIGKQIIATAIEEGATMAGIADMTAVKTSASHLIYPQMGDYTGVGTVKTKDTLPDHLLFNWPDSAKSVLVIGLSHPRTQPELDWWDGRGTPGNRLLIDILERTRRRIENELDVSTLKLHYYVEKGGVFLKDAAVLAGLGCIGENNLLVTPAYGPRIRLRALLLAVELEPTGPVDFDPCATCRVDCRGICPEGAMDRKAALCDSTEDDLCLPARDGVYDREICNIRMEKDISDSKNNASTEQSPVKYCRKCEFVCPVGKKRKQ